jgi:1,4-dihydroxy-2-naphthoyl-CoA hydrolase
MPFTATLGVELVDAEPAEVRASLAWEERLCTAGGIMHGGALMALADSAGAVCAYLNLPDGATTTTIESKTNLTRAVRSGVVVAVARPIHVGRSVIVVQTETRDEEGRLVALTVQTQAVLAG